MTAYCPGLQSKTKLLQGAHFIIPALDELEQHEGPSVRHCKAAPAPGSLRSKPDKAENSPEVPFPRLEYFRWIKLQVLAGSSQLWTICFVSRLLKRYQGEFFPLILFLGRIPGLWFNSIFWLHIITLPNKYPSKGTALPLADPLGPTRMSVQLRHFFVLVSPPGPRGHHDPDGKQHFMCTQEQGWGSTILTCQHSPRLYSCQGWSPRSFPQEHKTVSHVSFLPQFYRGIFLLHFSWNNILSK